MQLHRIQTYGADGTGHEAMDGPDLDDRILRFLIWLTGKRMYRLFKKNKLNMRPIEMFEPPHRPLRAHDEDRPGYMDDRPDYPLY